MTICDQRLKLTLRCLVRSQVTIPTTSNAITETPANTPNPIGNTCSFFPGGSTNAGAPAFSEFATGVGVGPDEGDGELPTSGRGPVGRTVLPDSGVPVGIGTEETPYRKS